MFFFKCRVITQRALTSLGKMFFELLSRRWAQTLSAGPDRARGSTFTTHINSKIEKQEGIESSCSSMLKISAAFAYKVFFLYKSLKEGEEVYWHGNSLWNDIMIKNVKEEGINKGKSTPSHSKSYNKCIITY